MSGEAGGLRGNRQPRHITGMGWALVGVWGVLYFGVGALIGVCSGGGGRHTREVSGEAGGLRGNRQPRHHRWGG